MRIASDGSVGIGTAAPATTLDVSGTTTLKGTTNLSNNNIISIGNAGIGTAAPAYKLDVIGSGSDSIVCRLQSSGAYTYTTYVNTGASNLDVGTGSGGHFIYGYGSYPLYFGVNGSEKMRITSAGNVGIGTSSPSVALDVNGSVRVTGSITSNRFKVTELYPLGLISWSNGYTTSSFTSNGGTLMVFASFSLYVGASGSNPTTTLELIGASPAVSWTHRQYFNNGSFHLPGSVQKVISGQPAGTYSIKISSTGAADNNDTLNIIVTEFPF
jgi:hypothetical protein